MREYGKVAPTFWTGTTGREIRRRGSDAVIVALYLQTSPHSNMLGLFYQPVLYMAHETGLGIEGARKGLIDCIESGFCRYDEASEMVWVLEMAKYQIADSLKSTDKRCAGIQKDYEGLPNNPHLGPFFDRYEKGFHLSKRREFEAPIQPPPTSPLVSPSEAPPKPGAGAGAGAGVSAEQKPLALVLTHPAAEPEQQSVVDLPLNDNTEHAIIREDVDEWIETFPAVDVVAELKRMRAWLLANPRKRKTARGINAFVVTWLSRQQDKPRHPGNASPRGSHGFDDDPMLGAQ